MKMNKWLKQLKRNRRDARKAAQESAEQTRPAHQPFVLESLEARILLSATPVEAVVTTDKADYSPGETAIITTSNQPSTLEGATFADGEMVQFQVTRTDGVPDFPSGNLPWYVIDGGIDAYQTDVNSDGQLDWVRADNDGVVNGSISTTWFVEDQYANSSLLLTATGMASHTVATTAFTDSVTAVNNVAASSASVQPGSALTVTFKTNTSDTIGAGQNSVSVTSTVATAYLVDSNNSATAIGSITLSNTNSAADTKTIDATVGAGVAAGNYTLRVTVVQTTAGTTTDSKSAVGPTITVTAVNDAPVINRDNAAVTVNEGTTASNTGTWSDANLGDTVTLSASIGTVSKLGTNTGGTWSWSYTPTDGPAGPTTVTVTASDGTTSSSTTFSLTVNNVAPTIAISGAATVNEGAVYSLTLGAVSDPGTDTVSSYLVHWGDGTSDSYGSNGVQTHTYADGPNTYNVTVDLTDGDGTFVNRANALSVSVLNVAPTATLQNNGSKTYGETVTISFTGASDPSNSDTSAGFHYAFATTEAGLTGVTYASGSSATASHDFTNLNAGSYTFWGRIIDQNGGFTDYSTNVTVSKATATVNVVDYSDVYDANAHTASVTITGVGGIQLAYAELIGTNVIDSGSVFAETTDSNYEYASGTATLTITKATATVVVTPYNVTYDGQAHTATYTITGVNGEMGGTVGTVDVSGTTHINAGTYNDSWTFTGAANYNDIAATAITNTIAKATLTGLATTQSALNIAKQGALVFSLNSITGLVNGDTLISLLSSMSFTLKVGESTYEFAPSVAIDTHGDANASNDTVVVTYSLKNGGDSGQLAAYLQALNISDGTASTSASNAQVDAIWVNMSTANYTFSDDALTKLFYSLK